MTSPADRKNQQVWDSLDAGAFKQALQLCNRRLKKGEKGDYLLILKAHTLTLLSTPAYTEESLQLARQLSTRNPPIDSSDSLRLLTRVWNSLGASHLPEISKLWERAVKSSPKNEVLAREWLWGTVRSLDWRGAQKAAMSLQGNFPTKREYWFWAVVTSLLLHNSLPESAPDRKLFGMLAYKMISKSRDDTPQDTAVVPPRAIQTSQEINLLLELLPYVSPETANKESLALLNSCNLGVDSKIGSGDWWGLTRRRLDVLEQSGDWMELWASCSELLKDKKKKEEATENGEGNSDEGGKGEGGEKVDEAADKKGKKTPGEVEDATKGRGDDWRVWECFVKAVGELYNSGDTEPGKTALEAILAHRASSASSRNPNLALVKFASVFHDRHGGPEGTPTLLEACKEYFTRTGAKSCCFEDLQAYLEMLEETETEEFLKFVENHVAQMSEDGEKAQIAKVAARINHHKFIYLLTISPLSPPFPEDVVSKLNTFITASLKIYTSSLSLGHALLSTDTQYGDDAALLSVMGLIRLSSLSSPMSQIPLYQSTTILSTLLQRSKHNYQALLLLIRIYLLLGAIPLAIAVYPRLNIKQIQNDTLAHFLLTRISTLLPGDPKAEELLKEAGKIYESSRNQTPGMLVLAYERGGYAQMMGFLEFSNRVSASVCRGMWEAERRRISRLRPRSGGAASAKESELIEDGSDNIWDNRDFGVVISCERSGKPRFEESFRIGPTPGENWAKVFSAVERLVVYYASTSSDDEVPQRTITTLTRILSDDTASSEFTPLEKLYITTINLLATATIASKKDVDAAKSALTAITTSLPPPPTPTTLHWEFLHNSNLILDLCTIISSFFAPHLTATTKKLTTHIPTLISAATILKRETTAAVSLLATEIDSEEGTDREQDLVDGVLGLDGVGKELRDWGVETVIEDVRGVRRAVSVSLAGVKRGE